MTRNSLANVDLNLLVPLQALLQERNVTRAAERVGVTQPAMSNSLKRLRALLGDSLLIKSGRGHFLTPRAMQLVDPVNEALLMVRQRVLDFPGFDPRDSARSFAVGSSSATAVAVLQPLLARWGMEGYRVGAHLVALPRVPDVLFETQSVDVALLPTVLPTVHPRERLYRERWVVVAAQDNPRIAGELTRSALAELPHAVHEADGLRTHAQLSLAAHAIEPRVRVIAGDFVTLMHLVAGSDMVAIVQLRLAQRLAAACGLAVWESPVPLPDFGLDMVWNPATVRDEANLWLRAQLRSFILSGAED